MQQRIAYEGSELTIEWYFDSKGYSQALEYFSKQTKDKQRKILNLFRLMGDQGKIFDQTKFMNENDGIYAFKPQPDRYLWFFFRNKRIIVTNAFMKKTQKLPQGEKRQALKAYQSYEERVKRGPIMKKKPKSTYEAFISDKKQRQLLDREYHELLVSELLLAAMEEDHLSVRKLAAAAGVSPTIIQGLRSGKKTNVTVDTLSRILDAIGYQIVLAPKSTSARRLTTSR
jgi:phage-related protein/DNA-binding Xre family transcriptional regulator